MSKLEKVIEEQDEKIKQLQQTIDYHERVINWMMHSEVKESQMAKKVNGYDKLPFPRIEMRINPLDEKFYSMEWLYGIVHKHFDGTLLFVPLGRTTSSGGRYKKMLEGEIEFPFRDGLHVRTDMKVFGLKGFVICGSRIEEIGDGEYSKSTYEEAFKEMNRS